MANLNPPPTGVFTQHSLSSEIFISKIRPDLSISRWNW